jgi:Cof subfamily protein (haloacid dehalogenase superfamily)
MHPIKLIALDLDGTLALPNHQVSPATREGLHQLQDDGVEVVIATGRRYRSALYVIDNLGLETYCVCNGGALVKDPRHNTLAATGFAADEYDQIVKCARENDIALAAQRDSHHLGGADFVLDTEATWNAMNHEYFETHAEFAVREDLLAQRDQYLIFSAHDTAEKLNRFTRQLQERCDHITTVVSKLPEHGHYYCEIALSVVDKWHGLSHLMSHFQLQDGHICAVGDEMNDFAMIEQAGHGIAMANGHPELQAIAKFVCGHNNDDGLLEAIRYIRDHNEKYGG